jgi:hypothetical protein
MGRDWSTHLTRLLDELAACASTSWMVWPWTFSCRMASASRGLTGQTTLSGPSVIACRSSRTARLGSSLLVVRITPSERGSTNVLAILRISQAPLAFQVRNRVGVVQGEYDVAVAHTRCVDVAHKVVVAIWREYVPNAGTQRCLDNDEERKLNQ